MMTIYYRLLFLERLVISGANEKLLGNVEGVGVVFILRILHAPERQVSLGSCRVGIYQLL
jgi:hypothetical protein